MITCRSRMCAARAHLLYYAEMPNPVVHFEIGCRDSARARQLYRDLFNGTIQEAGPAAMISDAGITGHIAALGHDPFRYTIFYVQVENVAAHIAKAEGLGCKKLVRPVAIPTRDVRLDRRSGRKHHRTPEARVKTRGLK